MSNRKGISLFSVPVLMALGSCAAAKPMTYMPPKTMMAVVTVADVRGRPVPASATYEYDPLEETQIIKGEKVIVLERDGDWYKIECPEQPEFRQNKQWQGYPGWVLVAALAEEDIPINLQTLPLPERDDLRKAVLEQASLHLGEPYLWGGRSLYDPSNDVVKTGVDCSGLVNWSFRQMGWIVPRDAHEQFMKARRLEPANMKPGDLFFLASSADPDKIVHVGFYTGAETLLEAPNTGNKVRRISFTARFGVPLSSLKNGQKIGDRVIYFGSFFGESPEGASMTPGLPVQEKK